MAKSKGTICYNEVAFIQNGMNKRIVNARKIMCKIHEVQDFIDVLIPLCFHKYSNLSF